MKESRTPYPSDVSDDEWGFVAPYLTLMTPDAPQRKYELREMYNGLRWMVKTGSQWRMMPHDLPPWHGVYDQAHRWLRAGVFEDIVDDLREILRLAAGKEAMPSLALLDSQTLRSTPESGARAGFDGGKLTTGSKIHAAVDTLGLLLSLIVTPANEQDRDQVAQLTQDIHDVTGGSVKVAVGDGSYTGERAAQAAKQNGIELQVVTVPQATRGFVVLPKRWIIERSFAWKSRFRRLVRDYERLPETLAGLHFAAFACLMLARWAATQIVST